MNIKYTHFFDDFDSSLVDSVAYDEPTQSAYLDLSDEVYRYDRVPFADVEALVQASSVGRAFNGTFMTKGFKQKFGPGTHLGWLGDITFSKRGVSVTAGSTTVSSDGTLTAPGVVGKNLSYADNAVVDGKPVTENTATGDVRVSLSGPVTNTDGVIHIPLKAPAGLAPTVPVGDELDFTVHFESNGSKTYTVKAASWQEAIGKLGEAAEILGVRVKVTGVFVHLV